MTPYHKPPELYDGLRLHQNENTGGCSPRVLEALGRLRADQIGFYPPYSAVTDAGARDLGVRAERAGRGPVPGPPRPFSTRRTRRCPRPSRGISGCPPIASRSPTASTRAS